jgi:hypothetical protein
MPSFGEKDKPGLFLGAEQSGMVEEAKNIRGVGTLR